MSSPVFVLKAAVNVMPLWMINAKPCIAPLQMPFWRLIFSAARNLFGVIFSGKSSVTVVSMTSSSEFEALSENFVIVKESLIFIGIILLACSMFSIRICLASAG